MAVNDFVSLLLGEAGGKNAAERYNDMLHIASVVVNRSLATGLPVEDIMANSNEFNAWGKALPAGTEQFRSIAQQAIQQVLDHGPVTNATFYATPTKTDNLPGGLQASTRTASHEFFTDPRNRAIGTANGYAPVSPVSMELTPPIPLTAPTPYSPLANLAPNGLAGYEFSPGPKRPGTPDPSITNIIREAVTDVLGPDARVVGHSGVGAYGSNRHGTGFAEDVQVYMPDGTRVTAATHPGVMRDIGRAAAARGATGIGFGSDYMRGRSFHIDRVAAARPGLLNPATQDSEWGNYANSMADDLAFARESGIGALPNTYTPGGIPTPTPRDVGMAMPAVPSLPNFAGGASPVPAPSPMMASVPMPSPPISASMAAPMPSPTVGPSGAVPMPGPMPFAATPSVPPALAAFERQFNPNSARRAQEESMAMYRLGLPAVEAMIEDRPRSAPAVPAAVPPINVPSPPRPDNAAYKGPSFASGVTVTPPASLPPVPASTASIYGDLTQRAQQPSLETDLPALAPLPIPAPRNAEAALLGGLMGPATRQIGQNIKSNFRGQPINPFAGIPQAYRDAFRGLGNRFNGMFGGSLPPPTPFSVGRGMSAINAVRSGGMAPGATAYSNSHPGASWSVNAYGIPEFTSQAGFKGAVPDGF